MLAGSFAGGTCGRSDQTGCDLYSATLDLGSGSVSDVERVTTSPRGEWMPTAAGDWIVFEERQGKRATLGALKPSDGTRKALGDGRYPDLSPDGSQLAWSTERPNEVHVADFRGGSLSGDRVVTTGRDPEFSPDGDRLIFHDNPGGQPTRTVVVDLGSGERTDFSDPDRCAHAAWSPDGELALCGTGGVLRGRKATGTTWGSIDTVLDRADKDAYPARFQSCGTLSYGYPAACDGDHWLVTVGCQNGPDLAFSNVLSIDLASGTVTDLHEQLREATGASSDAQSASATCLPS